VQLANLVKEPSLITSEIENSLKKLAKKKLLQSQLSKKRIPFLGEMDKLVVPPPPKESNSLKRTNSNGQIVAEIEQRKKLSKKRRINSLKVRYTSLSLKEIELSSDGKYGNFPGA
jgi:hypothetical protein